MSRLRILSGITAVLSIAPLAHAQDGQPDRFFSDKVSEADAEGEESDETLIQGSLTSSTFVYSESGGTAASDNQNVVENASPATRLYTDLRAQLDAKHIAGSSFDVRLDARGRLSSSCDFASGDNEALFGTCRTQSGLYGDNEYDLRELYVHRTGASLDLRVGRQYVHDLAATKIDGLSAHYQASERISLLGFAGLYPARGSRSVTEDYPVHVRDGEEQGRLMPIAGGAGGAYRFQSLYGSLGAVAIAPLADEADDASEPARLFVTSNGYWRPSSMLDFYHFVVVDLQGSSGGGADGLTNLSLGVNFRPVPSLRVNGAVNIVDSETLEVIAQNRLENDGNMAANVVQNHIAVTRIASHSYRLGVSASLNEQRFEVSASGQVRYRPAIDVPLVSGPSMNPDDRFEASSSGEIMLAFVDRRSFLGFRLGASLLRILDIGIGADLPLGRSEATVVRLHSAKEFAEGRGQYDIDVSFLTSNDAGNSAECEPLSVNPFTCFGGSEVMTLSLGGTVFYRLDIDWMLMGSANVARQDFSTTNSDNVQVDEDANLLLSGFARVAYRF